MAIGIFSRFKNAWNAFTSRDPTTTREFVGNSSYSYPNRSNSYISSDGSIIEMVKNRIAVDAAQIDVRHIRTDDEGNYKEDISSSLNEILRVSANIDQTGRAFRQDLIQSLLDEGYVAALPIHTDVNPYYTDSYDIKSMRVGKIKEWFPYAIRVEAYNEETGRREDMIYPKEACVIVENPFYAIMNAPNSTLQRLIRTLRNLDIVNDKTASGKLDLIIQLPYSLKSPVKQQQAESRRQQIEKQLEGSRYGIAYIDAAEHVTQLNRALENNLWKEASDLTTMLFNQLGLTQSIFDGTADDKAMNAYYNRTIAPILSAIAEEFERKMLSKTARTQGQAIRYFRDPFGLSTAVELSGIIQQLSQNEIISSNEGRARLGFKPAKSERADDLLNKNINKVEDPSKVATVGSNTLNNETNKNQNDGINYSDEGGG